MEGSFDRLGFFSPSVFSYGLFGSLKKEGEESRGRESNSITLFGSFLRKEGEEFGGVWRGFNYL